MTNPYATLGVSKSASQDEIKKAFKKMARQYHPDINKDPKAEEKFKEVNAAYDAIGDPEKRAIYDEFGDLALQPGFDVGKAREWPHAQSGSDGPGGFRFDFGDGAVDMEEFFSNMFGGGHRTAGFRAKPKVDPRSGDPRRGHPDFSGFGADFGRGRRSTGRGQDQTIGITIDAMTAILGGERRLSVPRHGGEVEHLNIRVPAGARDGGKLRLQGQGPPPYGGGTCGDLIVLLKVAEHPLLRRAGDDLELDVPLTVREAMQGAQITVPTPTGDVRVTVPAGVEPGQKLRLRGRGVQKKGSPGDLYLYLQVVAPKTEDPALIAAAEALDAAYGDVRGGLKL